MTPATASVSAPKPDFIDLDQDEYVDEDELFQEQMRRAMEASQSQAGSSRPSAASVKPQIEHSDSTKSFLSERAKMEQERLQRQKRLRKEAGSDDSIMESSAPSTKRQNTNQAAGSSSAASSSRNFTASPIKEEAFWNGECRPTGNQFCDPRKDGKATFRLTDALGKVFPLSL